MPQTGFVAGGALIDWEATTPFNRAGCKCIFETTNYVHLPANFEWTIISMSCRRLDLRTLK